MKNFRFTIAIMTFAALCCMVSCEKQKPEDDMKDDDKEIYSENTWIADGIENDLVSTALTMIGDNLAIAASTEEGLTDVTSIMESEEFFYAAVSPVLMNKEFNPKNETSAFTIISTLNDAVLDTVAPDKTDEIQDGKCLMTFEDNVLTLNAKLILADGTEVGLHITAEAREDEEIVINENIIGRGDEIKPLRAGFYKEQEGTTYLFFTPANISYFSELDIATWYLYLAMPTDLIRTKSGSEVLFGMVDNTNADNNFEISTDAGSDTVKTFYIATSGDGKYTADISFIIDGITYCIQFDGTCISADIEKPVEVFETSFTFNGETMDIESAVLIKGDQTWTLELSVSNGKKAEVTMPVKFWAYEAVGFSYDAENIRISYDGNVYNKANGSSGTINLKLNEELSQIEIKFTNYNNLEFYYNGSYSTR